VQSFTSVSGDFTVTADFQLLSSGTTVTGGRIFNMLLRDGANSIINLRTTSAGAIEMYSGGWQAITTVAGGVQNENPVADDGKVYRLTISGTISGASSSYDLTLLNLTDGTTAASASNISYFQTASPTQISRIDFARGYSDSDYIIDNVSVIPEPGTFALLAGMSALCALALRRRK